MSMAAELAPVMSPPDTVRSVKLGEDAVVKCCPVLKASSVSPMESAMTLKVTVSVAEVAPLIVEESDTVRVSPEVMV